MRLAAVRLAAVRLAAAWLAAAWLAAAWLAAAWLVAVWLAAVAVPGGGAPTAQALEQLRRGLVADLSAPDREMFAEAGFEDVVRFARTGPRPG